MVVLLLVCSLESYIKAGAGAKALTYVDTIYTDTGLFYRAEIYFYMGEVDSAAKYYASVSARSMFFNDAWTKLMVIRSYPREAVSMYGKVRWELRRGNYRGALKGYDNLVKVFPMMEPQVLLDKARIYSNLRKWKDAETCYKTLMDRFVEDWRGEVALYELAILYERMKLKDKAIATYEEFLMKYPTSIYAPLVRERWENLTKSQ